MLPSLLGHAMEIPLITRVSLFVVCIGIVATSLETLVARAHYSAAGLMSWDVVRTARRSTAVGPMAEVCDRIFGERGFLWLNVVRLATALLAMGLAVNAHPSTLWVAAALVVLSLLTMLYHFRNYSGLDGSDQMTGIVLTALALMTLTPDHQFLRMVCIWFVALQSALSYCTAGVAKLISKEWRNGTSLIGVMNTASYGIEGFSRFLKDHRMYAVALTWLLIGFECLFPVALLMGKYCLIFLAGGLIFHLLNAAIMGLNNFTWAFLATYPALLFCALQVRGGF